MKELQIMDAIQNEKAKDIHLNGNPDINSETIKVFERKKVSIDQPYTEVKADPLR